MRGVVTFRLAMIALAVSVTCHAVALLFLVRPGWREEWLRSLTAAGFGTVIAAPLLAGITATVLVAMQRPGIDDVIAASRRTIAGDWRLIRWLIYGGIGGLALAALGAVLTVALSGVGGRPAPRDLTILIGGAGFTIGGILVGAALARVVRSAVAGPLATLSLLVVATYFSTMAGSAITRPADATSTLIGLVPDTGRQLLQFAWFVGVGVVLLGVAWRARGLHHRTAIAATLVAAVVVVPVFAQLRRPGSAPFDARRPILVCDTVRTPEVCVAREAGSSLPRVADVARTGFDAARRFGFEPRGVLVQLGGSSRETARADESPLPASVAHLTRRDVMEALATDAPMRCHPGRDISDREALAVFLVVEFAETGRTPDLGGPRWPLSEARIHEIGRALASCAGDVTLDRLGVSVG